MSGVSCRAYRCRREASGPIPAVPGSLGLAYLPGRARGHAAEYAVRGARVRGVHVGVVRARHRVQHREGDIDHRVDVQAGVGGRPASRLVSPVRGSGNVQVSIMSTAPGPARAGQRAVQPAGDIALYYLVEGRHRQGSKSPRRRLRRRTSRARWRVLRHRGDPAAGRDGGARASSTAVRTAGDQLGPAGQLVYAAEVRKLAPEQRGSRTAAGLHLHRTGEHVQRVGGRGGTSPAARLAPGWHRHPGQEHRLVRGSRRLHPASTTPSPSH